MKKGMTADRLIPFFLLYELEYNLTILSATVLLEYSIVPGTSQQFSWQYCSLFPVAGFLIFHQKTACACFLL